MVETFQQTFNLLIAIALPLHTLIPVTLILCIVVAIALLIWAYLTVKKFNIENFDEHDQAWEPRKNKEESEDMIKTDDRP